MPLSFIENQVDKTLTLIKTTIDNFFKLIKYYFFNKIVFLL